MVDDREIIVLLITQCFALTFLLPLSFHLCLPPWHPTTHPHHNPRLSRCASVTSRGPTGDFPSHTSQSSQTWVSGLKWSVASRTLKCVYVRVQYKLQISLKWNVSVTLQCSLVKWRESKHKKVRRTDRDGRKYERNDEKVHFFFSRCPFTENTSRL